MDTKTDATTTPENGAPTKPEIVRETISAQHKFSDAEKLALSDRLIESMKSQDQIDAEFNSLKAEYKGRIEKAQLDTDSFRQKLSDGFEMRPTVARIVFNHPEPGRKTYVRDYPDGYAHLPGGPEVIREEAMSFADQERPLFKDVNGKDATAPAEDFTNTVDGEGTREDLENAVDTSEASTPLGAALNAEAVKTEAPPILIEGLDKPDWTSAALIKVFVNAAAKAQWTTVQISTVRDALKQCDEVSKMVDVLRPFTVV